MAKIFETKNSIVFENNYVEIEIAKENALIGKIIDKKTGNNIKSKESINFFALKTKEEESIEITAVALDGDVLTVSSTSGDFKVEAHALESYFTFELVTALPSGVFVAYIAEAKYDYDYSDKSNTGAVGVAMTVKANARFYPDAKSLETGCEVYPHLADIGAKYALIIAPITEHRDILKEVVCAIDKNEGIRSSVGGAFSRDSRLNFSNYTIQYESTKEFIQNNIEYFKSIGVDQIDFHKGTTTFRQGDFKFMRYENGAEFKKNVSDVLEANGMSAGLHTYTHYITYDCDAILSKPENLRQLKIMESFTLAEDIAADSTFVPTAESTECVSDDFGFCRTNTPYVLVDDELILFENAPNGFKVKARGCSGTAATSHKKGAAVKHVEGHYHGFCPILGSDLFFEIARGTAKAFNEGGFKMIYLDALDGIYHHCDRKTEAWYYMGLFIHEVLKNCKVDPILEGAAFPIPMWPARGRSGAQDTPYRGYKGWNRNHAETNKTYIDRYNAPILGWYNFYPMTDMYPGNEHTRYHHTDSIEHMGSIAVMYDFANVFNGMSRSQLDRYPGLRRNIAIYKKYDDLRKAQYFSEEYRRKLIDSPYEVALIEKRGKKYSFVEKDYQIKKMLDLGDTDRNKCEFKNPFGAQTPFVRIEAMLSTAYRNGMVLLPLDESKELTSQNLKASFGGEINLTNNLAKTVKVTGNGVKGSKICVKLFCATNSETGYGEYIIDTDFNGWREFILIESDNGERTDHGFEKGHGLYAVYRSSLNNDRITGIRVETEGDMTGVKMSSVIAYEHTYELLKNPTVKIGNTSVMFECELQSSDFIEFDGKTAKVVDRYGNEKPIWFSSTLKAPRGKFNAELTAKALNRGTARAQLTLGFTGKEIK